jgi:hypothetical protein
VEKLAKDTVTIVFLCVRQKEGQFEPLQRDKKVKLTTKFNFFKSHFDKLDSVIKKHLLRKCFIWLKKS